MAQHNDYLRCAGRYPAVGNFTKSQIMLGTIAVGVILVI